VCDCAKKACLASKLCAAKSVRSGTSKYAAAIVGNNGNSSGYIMDEQDSEHKTGSVDWLCCETSVGSSYFISRGEN